MLKIIFQNIKKKIQHKKLYELYKNIQIDTELEIYDLYKNISHELYSNITQEFYDLYNIPETSNNTHSEFEDISYLFFDKIRNHRSLYSISIHDNSHIFFDNMLHDLDSYLGII